MKRLIVATSLAGLLFGVPQYFQSVRAADETTNAQVNLRTVFLSTPMEGAHQLSLSGELGGAGTLQLDPNKCGLNEFGDVTFCTRMATRGLQVQINPIDVADPAGDKRKTYELVGKGLTNQLFLIAPHGSAHGYRLVSKNEKGVDRVVALETKTAPGAGGGGAKPAGKVNAQVDVPQGAQKGAAEFHAFQVPGWVIVTASGHAPTPGHKVYLWQLPLKIYPPQFEILWVPSKDPVIQVLHPFRISTRFRADKKVDSVIVHDRDGRHEVKVQQVPESADQTAHGSEPAMKKADGIAKREAKAGFLPSGRVQVVTGTSNDHSLDKALDDAVGKLVAPFPDAQFRIKVLEIGGTHGGIAGMTSLEVTVMGSLGK